MADVSKAQKLASARKKFKELKKEKKKNTAQKAPELVESPPTSREQTPVEGLTNEPAQLPNYFSNVNFNNGYQQPTAFFDNFSQNNDPFACITPSNNLNGDQNHAFSVPEDNKNDEISNFQAFDSVKFDQKPSPRPQLSTVESLRQLQDQMAELISPPENEPLGGESPLEIRNQELAELLNQEKVKNEELNASLREYQTKLSQLEAELKDKQLNTDTRVEHEVSTLREELQCHVQTVGILVAEKAELVANLSQFQLAAKQKTAECEELQGRLKTSRSRVADLEREVALLKNEKSQYDNMGREQNSELEKLKQSYQSVKDEKEELLQDLLEAREKLKSSSESCVEFQQQIKELSNQLSMANIKIQQLTTGDQDSSEIEKLTQEKFALEKQVADLSQTVKTLSKEREESSLQYQQYAQQLNAQLSSLATRLETSQKENESLAIREQDRIKHIGELEKQLQNLQNDQVSFAVQKPTTETKAELEAALELVERLKTENVELQEENVKAANEKELLLKELEAKGESISELERIVEELRTNQPDSGKLLAIMESDKVAAARAVSQNTELKNQMDSMQEVFMKLNNDKIELTEKLTIEQRNNKELFEKLQKTELHLQTLADAIEIKDKELSHLRENSSELDKQLLQSEQLNDRLRHYEAQDHSSQALQNELFQANQTIEKLNEEIKQLKVCSSDVKELRENETKDATDSNHNGIVLDKEAAMKHLEEKFLKTMEDIANLTEEKQRLEHLVLQLQGETETIGEYVALYQQQRSLLKQKAIEKDQQLSQLANDRELMKAKLDKLNELVKKLVLEKGAVPSELLEHHHDNHLCEEHAKISNEINKIAQNTFTVEPSDTQSTETAEEIIALLSEIKTSNLVQPAENIHHCPWCSGQLITV
ncbi:hypothetical protein TcasGA2_TC014602 [Tribolium castaneum]|uniref:Golgin subfamily A conserved domain-containing protein n=2 Tax=Tribolium castaneum TaxID=7070 RepID=D6WMW0_TRICA|nr:hypothetical protein TcasGA2_TC014602 [Tribolium castaneum]